jgi:predicted secreted Zn-dependent protease
VVKDHIISLVEAVRLSRLELACQQDPNCRASEEWTLKRLRELLGSKEVSEAMAAFVPEEADISLVPDDSPQFDLLMSERAD